MKKCLYNPNCVNRIRKMVSINNDGIVADQICGEMNVEDWQGAAILLEIGSEFHEEPRHPLQELSSASSQVPLGHSSRSIHRTMMLRS